MRGIRWFMGQRANRELWRRFVRCWRCEPMPTRQEITQSLNWLENAAATVIQSPGSLALVEICFKVYGRRWPSSAPDLSGVLQKSGFLDNTVVAAWTVLASGSGFWLGKTDARTVAA